MSKPSLLDAQAVTEWHETADVIVMGFGMAGACSAITAHDSGARVLIVEVAGGSGGTSASAGGHFYLGAGTPVQKACGFEDSVEDMRAYLTAQSIDPDAEKIRLYAENSVAHFDWLEQQGIPFERSYFPTKAVLQKNKQCLIWTGNEKVAPFRDVARPAPRGHKIAAEDPVRGGAMAMEILTAQVEKRKIPALYGARVTALVEDGGRIVGLRYREAGQDHFARAERGVIIASGGYGQNEDMLREYVPKAIGPMVERIAGPNDMGDGIRLGMAAGAATRHLDNVYISTYFYPPPQLLQGILVNSQGRRFVAEDSYHARSAANIIAQEDGRAYLIVDSETFAWPESARDHSIELVDACEDIASMEQALSVADGVLVETIRQYNEGAKSGKDEFGKHPDWLKPFDNGPYAAFDMSFNKIKFRMFTVGGLRVSAQGEVLREDGTRIEGLFAAGAAASNIAQAGISYNSGTCLGTASFFGRRTGAQAAAAT